MYARTIRRALKDNPLTRQIFIDVRAADRLPYKANEQHGIYVVNTHPNHMPGEHWTAVEYTPTHVSYFDPYGEPPHPLILKHLRVTNALRRKPIFYTAKRIQGYRQTCGYYCIFYVLTRSDEQYTMNIFNSDLDFNDRLVKQLVSQRFNVNKTS